MKKTTLLLGLLICFVIAYAQTGESYPVDSASIEQAGVPKGEIIHFVFDHSSIFPGTRRDCWVYVPVQYKANKPACVYVNQDGIQWKAPTVFDNLIYRNEMPVTIGIFVMHGQVLPDSNTNAVTRFNRSFEYDGLGDNYTRFLLTELLPAIEKMKTSDGRSIRLSQNGNDRAIGGSSSGAICAFTTAWEHPEAFSRVFSAIGTYVGLRGGNEYSTLIRKYEPKRIRIFLQDGSSDLDIYAGDWWKANEMMERSLRFSGYEVNHAWGTGSHSGAQGNALFPQVMRWLWKDWPQPVGMGVTKNQFLSDLLIPGEDWELVGEGYQFSEGTAASPSGDVYFQDIPTSKTYRVASGGKPLELKLDAKRASGNYFGPDEKRYTVAGGSQQLLRYDGNERETVIADSLAANDLVVASNGNIYVTVPDGVSKPSRIYLIRPGEKKRVVDEGLRFANGITLSPDQTQLYVTESASHWVWIYKVNADGTLGYKQRYGWLHMPDAADNAWGDGIRCDTAGRMYVASRLGIQVMDQLGRVNVILPLPPSNSQASNVCFGGPAFNVLYVSCGDKVYRRKLRTRGVNAFEKPVRPANPHL